MLVNLERNSFNILKSTMDQTCLWNKVMSQPIIKASAFTPWVSTLKKSTVLHSRQCGFIHYMALMMQIWWQSKTVPSLTSQILIKTRVMIKIGRQHCWQTTIYHHLLTQLSISTYHLRRSYSDLGLVYLQSALKLKWTTWVMRSHHSWLLQSNHSCRHQ